MKYLVELKFTNPAHEHVSLRRRVESVTRLVEARNESEAILRASNQQRSLGFMIKEAKVVKEKSHDKGADETIVSKGKEVMKKAEGKDEEDEEEAEDIEEGNGTTSYPLLKPGQKLKPMKLKMGEGFDPEPSDIAAYLVKKHGKGKVTKDHVDAYERDRDSNKAIDKEAVMKHVEKMSEEVELDEAKKPLKPSYWKAEWRLGTQSDVDKNNKKIFDKLAKTDPVKAAAFHDNLMRMKKKDVKEETVDEANMRFDYEAAARPKSSDVKNFLNRNKNPRAAAASKKYIRRMTKLGGLGPNQTKKDTEAHMKANFEEVEKVEENRAMSAAIAGGSVGSKILTGKMDPNFGYPANKMPPHLKAAQAKSDALSKPEKKHQAGTLGAHKARKAAERMVDAQKKKVNKINMQPSMETGKHDA